METLIAHTVDVINKIDLKIYEKGESLLNEGTLFEFVITNLRMEKQVKLTLEERVAELVYEGLRILFDEDFEDEIDELDDEIEDEDGIEIGYKIKIKDKLMQSIDDMKIKDSDDLLDSFFNILKKNNDDYFRKKYK